MIYLQLFWSFLQIGLFSIGGGYAAMPLIQAQVVQIHPWLNMSEFTDLVTIAEMTPGPIAINAATFVGTRIAGPAGAAVASVIGYLCRIVHSAPGCPGRTDTGGGESEFHRPGPVCGCIPAAAQVQMEPHPGDVPVRRGKFAGGAASLSSLQRVLACRLWRNPHGLSCKIS